jgi:hypothetical protein
MDTFITDRPEIQVEDMEEVVSDRLHSSGTDHIGFFRSPDGNESLAPEAAPLLGKKRRRNGIMVTACGIAVVAVAGGVFWISPYNHYSLADASRLASQARGVALQNLPSMAAPAPIAPAARLARAPDPTRAPLPYRKPADSPAVSQPGDDMAEFLKLGGQTPAAPALAPERSIAVAPTATPRIAPPATPAVPAPRQALPTEPVTDPAKKTAEAIKPSAAVIAQTPPDAVAAIAALRPAPMTEPQQVQVLELVTQLGTLVRDQHTEIAQLRLDQKNVGERVDSALSDFSRRISLAEARGAVSAAMGVEPRPAQAAAGAAGSSAQVLTPVAARSVAPAATLPHRYHVQAASPGLAMLSELDPSGGEERQLPVSPGDDVPGWGKVVSISQRGTTWTVKTDHGLIQ